MPGKVLSAGFHFVKVKRKCRWEQSYLRWWIKPVCHFCDNCGMTDIYNHQPLFSQAPALSFCRIPTTQSSWECWLFYPSCLQGPDDRRILYELQVPKIQVSWPSCGGISTWRMKSHTYGTGRRVSISPTLFSSVIARMVSVSFCERKLFASSATGEENDTFGDKSCLQNPVQFSNALSLFPFPVSAAEVLCKSYPGAELHWFSAWRSPDRPIQVPKMWTSKTGCFV